MAPTPAATLGVKGHRPVVGTWDRRGLPYVFAVVNLVTAAVHPNAPESPKDAETRTGPGKTRRMQAAFAAHLRHVARVYPAGRHERVVLLIGNAPWHRGKPTGEGLRDHPRRGFRRSPSYRPQLDPIERLWKVLRRRAAHDRLFDPPADLGRSIRNGLCYFRTARDRVETLLDRRSRKQSQSPGS